MRAAKRGDVVMISSNTVPLTPAHAAPYTMAKAAMETCVLTLAREERAHGIRANVVAPGLVMTEMGRRLVKASAGADIEDLDAAAPPSAGSAALTMWPEWSSSFYRRAPDT